MLAIEKTKNKIAEVDEKEDQLLKLFSYTDQLCSIINSLHSQSFYSKKEIISTKAIIYGGRSKSDKT